MAQAFVFPDGRIIMATDARWGTDATLQGNVIYLSTRRGKVKAFYELGSSLRTMPSAAVTSLERRLKSLIAHPREEPIALRLLATSRMQLIE